MNRAAAMTAASALCLLWTAGCASTGQTSAPAATSAAPKSADATAEAMPDSRSDVATLTKNLPSTLDGEIRRAQLLRSKGDYDEAAHSLAQLILFAPDDARVVGEYGKVLEQEGHSREALPFLQRAVQLQPNDASVQSALGVAYDQLDQHTNARAAYERALALKPGDASVLNNYAVSRMLAGDYAGAQRLFAQAQARDSSNLKITGNIEKLTALTPPLAPATGATPPSMTHPASPVPAANVSQPSVKIGEVAPVQHPPASAATKGGNATSGERVAVAGPKALGAPVVMQRVPHDPLAGPVSKTASAKARKSAHAMAAKSLPQPETPSLRTAADSN